jgi:hypothetical protein
MSNEEGCKLYHPLWLFGLALLFTHITFYVGGGLKQYHFISTSLFPVNIVPHILLIFVWNLSEHQRPHLPHRMTQHLTWSTLDQTWPQLSVHYSKAVSEL